MGDLRGLAELDVNAANDVFHRFLGRSGEYYREGASPTPRGYLLTIFAAIAGLFALGVYCY